MDPRSLFITALLAALFTTSLSLDSHSKPLSNITVLGAVFCDACSSNTFSNHSYFLQGAKVRVECKFRVKLKPNEEISIMAERTTDAYGFYRVDIPPVEGFECREGREIQSFCRGNLMGSSSSLCNVSGLRSSTGHMAIKSKEANICFFNLNAMNYRPPKIDAARCGNKGKQEHSSALDSSLFFWPPSLPFGIPWPQWPPLPFPFPPIPFPSPPSFPFHFPPWLPFQNPPAFQFPFPLPPLPPLSAFFPPSSPPSPPSSNPGSWFPFFPPPLDQPQKQHP